jgi:quercetin dioxygenase-like cupin family protein
VFRSAAPGRFIDWHPAPRRQFVITISGEVELGRVTVPSTALGPGTSTWLKT